jgi:hypothetical protein
MGTAFLATACHVFASFHVTRLGRADTGAAGRLADCSIAGQVMTPHNAVTVAIIALQKTLADGMMSNPKPRA